MSVQTVDLDNPWIVLLKLRSMRCMDNPWIAQPLHNLWIAQLATLWLTDLR